MLSLLIAILGIIITILLIVGVHEFGHFVLARWTGVKVLRFSIGFGKTLLRWHDKKGTEYIVAAVPLGGYVKLLDETEEAVPSAEKQFAFNRQPFYKKFLIVVAGPIFNVIFAFLLYWIIFMTGFVSIVPLIGKITPDSIAAQAGMKPNQEIIQIDNRQTVSWLSVIIGLLERAGDKTNLNIQTKNPDTQATHSYSLDLKHWQMNNLKPDPLESLGISAFSPTVPAIIGEVLPKSPAASKLKPGDKILMVNKQPIKNWHELLTVIEKNPDTVLAFKIKRGKKTSEISVKTGSESDTFFKKHGYLGVVANYHVPENLLKKNKYGPFLALSHAWQETKDFCNLNIMMFGKLVTGKISLSSLGGPITIFQSAGTAINQGITPFLSFLAFLSISIGLLNILPIPGLDGGLIFFQIIEFLIRRPLPLRFQVLIYRLGLIFILLLIAQALANDILRL